jgi:hypothetical protein
MCEVFEAAFQKIRDTHIPALFHVEEVTQPQGHSTSGSHERYKSPERLVWEKEWDANKKMREWILENDLSNEEELSEIEYESKEWARQSKNKAWEKFFLPIKELLAETLSHLDALAATTDDETGRLAQTREKLRANREPYRKDMITALHASIELAPPSRALQVATHFYERLKKQGFQTYGTHLFSEAPNSPLLVQGNEPQFDEDSPSLNGYEILNRYFDQLLSSNEKVVAFGEDLGKIGDVNQGFAGLQAKHGEHRIFDTGIRELSIIGQGIGLAMRGLRPIAEIQYVDYLLYGLQPLSDDAASLHWRSKGRQSAPLIVRTRGHRLEGIWHSGSPMSLMLSALRGMCAYHETWCRPWACTIPC